MKSYKNIIKHYEDCFEKFGDNHLGVDWPNKKDVSTRYQIMLELILLKNEGNPCSLLDFGCGTAHLLEYIQKNKFDYINYSGLDLSEKFVNVCLKKFPNETFYCVDILADIKSISSHDYVVMNGVFTEKRDLSFEQMWEYFKKMIEQIMPFVKKGLAFNVMSKNVDWERDDLFHVSLDLLSNYLCENITRNFVIRNDYGLYEYTVYIYK